MNHPGNRPADGRVLVLAPTAADAAHTRSLLAEAGVDCDFPADLPALCRDFDAGVAAVVLTEEAVAAGDPDCLVQALRRQPPWSDVPILFLAGHGTDSPVAAWAMDLLGNVTVLERPVRVTTLVSSLRTALRARRRQYELRDRMETLARQSERLRLLWEAASVLLSTEEPVAMMRGLFARIAPQFGLDAYFNFMVDEAGDALRMESCAGIPDDEAGKIRRLEFGQAVCGTVARHRRPIVAARVQESDDPKVQLIRGYGIRAYACNPLVAGDRLLGTLSFASRTRDDFEPDELEFLETVCHYVAYAYERLRLIRRLREADRHKDEFLATLAHELRNPLAPIRNAVQFLWLKGAARPGLPGRPRDHRPTGHPADPAGRRPARRVADHAAARSPSASSGSTWRRSLTTAVESVRPLIEARRPRPGHAACRRSRSTWTATRPGLAQVFGNLLNNAAKYTDRGGHIRLTAERQRATGWSSRPRHRHRASPPSTCPGSSTCSRRWPRRWSGRKAGSGSACRWSAALVEMHGGGVEAHSEGAGRGSEFVVRLPTAAGRRRTTGRRRRAADQRHRPAAGPPHPGGRRQRRRRREPGHDALDHGPRRPHRPRRRGGRRRWPTGSGPTWSLLDIGMPRLNGYEVARLIRRMPWAESAVIAALTGWGQDADKHRAAEAGFDRHFTKPLDPDVLDQLLAEMTPAVA